MMKAGDQAAAHRQKMKDMHALFQKKTQYHRQKAYLELKDVYWLVSEFFSAFLGKEKHFTEEELVSELATFQHEFITIPADTTDRWKSFFTRLSEAQYAGASLSQQELQGLVERFGALVDETVGEQYAPQDEFTRHVQAAKLYVTHGEAGKAEETYRKLMMEYDDFDADRKRKHYEQLERLYESIAALRSGQPAARQ